MQGKLLPVLLVVLAPIVPASCVGMGHDGWTDIASNDDVYAEATNVDSAPEIVDMPGRQDDGGMMGGARHVGDACFMAMPCPAGGSGTKACETAWPGGYCVIDGCAEHDHDCPSDGQPGGSTCVLFNGARCLALCSAATDCREGYACAATPDAAGHGTVTVCVPE